MINNLYYSLTTIVPPRIICIRSFDISYHTFVSNCFFSFAFFKLNIYIISYRNFQFISNISFCCN